MLYPRWTTKPPQGTPVDPTHPLAPNVGCWIMNEGCGPVAYNSVGGGARYNAVFQSGSAAPTWTNGINGSQITTSSASSQYVSCGNITELNGAKYASLFVKWNRSSTSNTLAVGRNTTAHQRFAILAFTDGNIYNYDEDGTGFNQYQFYPSSFTGDVSCGWSFQGEVNIPRFVLCLNGVDQGAGTGSGPGNTTALATSTDPFLIGRDPSDSVFSTGSFAIVMLWVGKSLQAGNYAYLHANPYDVFMPEAFLFKSSTKKQVWPYLDQSGSSFSDLGIGAI